MAVISNVLAAAGILLAVLLYLFRRRPSAAPRPDPLEKGGPLHALLSQKYYLDALYDDLVVRRWFYAILVAVVDKLDRILDDFVDLLGGAPRNAGQVIALFQTGQVQFYGAVVVLGSIVILAAYLILGAGG